MTWQWWMGPAMIAADVLIWVVLIQVTLRTPVPAGGDE